MKKTYELLNLKLKESSYNNVNDSGFYNVGVDDSWQNEKNVRPSLNGVKDKQVANPMEQAQNKYKADMKETSKISYDFFSIYPVESGAGIANDSRIFEGYKRDCKPFIKAVDKTHCVLYNFDKLGNIYENKIEITNDKLIVETNDPQAYNIALCSPKGDRYKHRLQSRELGFILEFYGQTRGNVWLKYEEKNIIKL